MSLEAIFDDFGRRVVKESRSNLTRTKHKDTSALWKSLKYTTKENEHSFEFSLLMAPYGDFVDKGVKGANESRKAPNSPYRFGSGKGKGNGGFRKAIDGWVKRKGIQFRNKKTGRFMTRATTSFLIRRSLWNTGMASTYFWSKPFERAFKRLPEQVVEAYALDMEEFMRFSTN